MSNPIRYLALVFVLSVSFSGAAFAGRDPGTYHSYNLPPFTYLYAGKDPDVVESLDRELRKIVPEMELHLGTRLPDKVEISLPLTRSEFAWLTGGRSPDWAGGMAYPNEDRIVVKAPQFFEEGVTLTTLAAHELAHLLLHQASSGQGIPRWFNEGFAQVLAKEDRSGSVSRLARAALADRLMGLPRVEDVLNFQNADANLAYAESHAAARGLLERYDWEVVRSILFTVGTGVEFDSAFHQCTEMEYEAWQVDWIESAQKRYKNFAFLDIESLIWVLIMLLGAAAAFAVWLRKRRQFREWAEEEAENGDKPISGIEEREKTDDKPDLS